MSNARKGCVCESVCVFVCVVVGVGLEGGGKIVLESQWEPNNQLRDKNV